MPVNGLAGHYEAWRYCDDPPVIAWDERKVLGSADFENRSGGQTAARVLLVGHSRDPDLAQIAARLSDVGAAVEVLLVDRLGRQPNMTFPIEAIHSQPYDVGYCRGYRPEQVVHFHFDRTLRRDSDWGAVDPNLAGHAARQAEGLLWSWLATAPVSRWINSPWRLRDAECKLVQLARAQQSELRVPLTLVTSDVRALRRFAETCSAGVIHKSIDSPVVSMHDGQGQFLYTSVVDPDEIDCLPYPCLFQERLVPRIEHRVTVVGRRVFTASLRREPGQPTDWRRLADDHHRFEHHQLSDALVSAVRELMSALDIQIGAVDLIETSEQSYFLEINPSAALTWLERALGMQLCQSVTNLILCGA